jgi:hypothetical protein
MEETLKVVQCPWPGCEWDAEVLEEYELPSYEMASLLPVPIECMKTICFGNATHSYNGPVQR